MTTPAALHARRLRVVELVAGIALIMASLIGVGLVYATFRGTFGDSVKVSAGITDAGDALEPGAAVTYRRIIVGEVRSAAQTADGHARVGLTIQARYAKVIPSNVLSIAVPLNLFGSSSIELVPPPKPSGRALRDGDVISADTSPGAAGLQTALADAYQLLTAIKPSDLDAALTALATALQGQGANLGALIEKADAYLRKLAPSLPTLEATINELATVTDELAKDSPNLLASLRDLLAPAKVVADRAATIATLLDVAPKATSDASALLDATGDNFVTVVNAQQAVLDAFRDNPQALPRTFDGFKGFADSFSATLAQGPYQRVNVLVTGANFEGLGTLIAGLPSQVLTGITDPTLYTVAQCPRYPGLSGPNCSSAQSNATTRSAAERLLAGSTTVHAAGGGASAQQVAAAREVLSAVSGLPPAQIPAAIDLILGPLLRGTATVVI